MAAKKVAAKKTAKKATKPVAEHGTERKHDLPWTDKKIAVFRALKSFKAVGAANAVAGSEVMKAGKVSARDVRHYSYHAKAAGLIDFARKEGVVGYAFFLTAKGAKVDLTKVGKES